jgi:hypothetical protein
LVLKLSKQTEVAESLRWRCATAYGSKEGILVVELGMAKAVL